jgi:hypothetical protein
MKSFPFILNLFRTWMLLISNVSEIPPDISLDQVQVPEAAKLGRNIS